MAIFNWEYLSFTTFDQTWMTRELLIIPVVVLILWVLWLRVIRDALNDKREEAMSLEEAYQEASIIDALSTDEEGEVDTKLPTTKEDLNEQDESEDKKDL